MVIRDTRYTKDDRDISDIRETKNTRDIRDTKDDKNIMYTDDITKDI